MDIHLTVHLPIPITRYLIPIESALEVLAYTILEIDDFTLFILTVWVIIILLMFVDL